MEDVKLVENPNINEKIVVENTRMNASLISEDDVQLIEENREVIVIESDSEPELLIIDNSIASTTETSVSLKVAENESKLIKKKKRKKASKKSQKAKDLENKLEIYLMKPSPQDVDIKEFHKVKEQLNLQAINSTRDGRWTKSSPKPGELLQVDSMSFTSKHIKIVCANTSTAKWLKFQKCIKKYRLVLK